jgi:serine/threonine protein kinase
MAYFQFSDYYFIDMELCDMSLQEYLYPDSLQATTVLGLPPFMKDLPDSSIEGHIWGIMTQISSGLKFIHSHSLVHRDLKPSNGNSFCYTH